MSAPSAGRHVAAFSPAVAAFRARFATTPGEKAEQDRGSLAIEYVIVAPLFLLVFALIFAFARTSQLDGLLDAGARDAARAVSIAPVLSKDFVHGVALTSVQDELKGGAGGCNAGSVSVTVVGIDVESGARDTGDLKPGEIAQVTVVCDYTLADLGLPVPGLAHVRATSVFASIIDPNRTA